MSAGWMGSGGRTLPLRLTLALLLPVAAAAALQASVLPRWPRVAALPAAQVQRQLGALGMPLAAGALEPPWRSADLALSSLRRVGLPQGLELQVQRLAVRQRPDFQLAMATRPWTPGRRGLALGPQRRLLQTEGGAMAVGIAQQRALRQTCLLPAGAGVSAEQLTALADQATAPPLAVLARLLGARPNRTWSCLMVSLSHAPDDRQASLAAAALWPRLLKALTPLAW